MNLINRWWCSSFRRLKAVFGFQDQILLAAIAVIVLGHLALFQLVDASTQSTSSSAIAEAVAVAKLSLPFGIDSKYALPKGKCRGQDVISSVPEKDRELFVFYHLAKALNSTSVANKNLIPSLVNIGPKIPIDKVKMFKDIPTYETFSADLLKWTMQTFVWSQFDSRNNLLLRRYKVLCTPKGWCFSPIDIGNMCCPF